MIERGGFHKGFPKEPEEAEDPCANGSHCCCCGPGEACCDCGAIMSSTHTGGTCEGCELPIDVCACEDDYDDMSGSGNPEYDPRYRD